MSLTMRSRVHGEYVDGKDLTYRQLVYSALKGAVSRLDPHSEFSTPIPTRNLQVMTQDNSRVGLMVGMKDGQITVIAPMDGHPRLAGGILSATTLSRLRGKTLIR